MTFRDVCSIFRIVNPSSPLVSVIVPVYNSGDYLRVCLDSLAAQDASDIEFICVNDGSTDGSPAELDARAAADPRFRVIHQVNGGYGKAMNAGLAAARGAYIGIVEPDDWVEPDMFSTLLRLIESSGADVAKADYAGETEASSRVGTKYAAYAEGAVFAPVELPEFLLWSPAIWSGLYRRDWLEAHAIRFSETPRASYQDLGFGMRTWAYAQRIVITPRALYHYREDNPNSSVRRMEEGAWAVLRELELQQDLFDSIPKEDTLRRSLLLRRAFHSFLADYRKRVADTLEDYLTAYSTLMQKLCPLAELQAACFKKREWHDIQLLYTRPLDFPAESHGVSVLHRLFSVRREAGKKILRLLGMRFVLSSYK